jgi:hypothetical protein
MSIGLPTALLITLVGMGLVFGAIIAFWLLMALLTRWTAGKRAGVGRKDEGSESELKRRAAVVAVAVAMALDAEGKPGTFAVPPTAVISTWQAVLRARHLGRRRSVE